METNTRCRNVSSYFTIVNQLIFLHEFWNGFLNNNKKLASIRILFNLKINRQKFLRTALNLSQF